MGHTEMRKYNEEVVQGLLEKALENVKKDKKMLMKEEVFLSIDIPLSYWSRWETDFANFAPITDLFEKITSILKSRIIKPAIKGLHNASFTQFYTKNAYSKEYKDKQTIEHEKGESMIEMIRELNGGDGKE